jgi:putative PEP-CTERM system histidine kinase
MLNGPLDLILLGNLLAALGYTTFALIAGVRILRKRAAISSTFYVFMAALLSSALWAWIALAVSLLPLSHPVDLLALPLADLLRYGLWFSFVLQLLKPGTASGKAVGEIRFLRVLALISTGAALALVAARNSIALGPESLAQPVAFASLALAVVGLILIEQLMRNVSIDARWNAKPVCLGLGVIFLFDLFVYSQAALFRTFDGDALSVRAAVHSAAVPLLFLASQRHADWLDKLHVSRAAVFHSATLVLVGTYLLLISAVGYYVRYTGGEWGRALQLVLVFLALLALAIVIASGAIRARLKVYISKNFFSYRYDYREEWLRFTAILSSAVSPQEMGDTVVRALANLVESPSGTLWLRRGYEGDFVQAARWNMPPLAERESASSSFPQFLRDRAWIVDFDQLRNRHGDYANLVVPAWLLADPRYWLAIPLLAGKDLIGFVILGRARAAIEINWEVRDLLKTASTQASSYLAQMEATEALLESKKFDAFNRMSAFVVHDLKNIVTQLSLMMKNAKRLRDNPEFQQDMLDTVDNSLEKMRQLMLQLREGEAPHGVSSGVDLELIAKRLAANAASKGRVLELQVLSRISTRGHADRVERVIGHVVQNAFDATQGDASVSLRLDQSGSQARVQIADRGCGMSDEFIQHRLFKPFQTTKTSGMGIGAYESYQYLQELGGKIIVESQLNQGTTVTILLPLFHAAASTGVSVMSSAK